MADHRSASSGHAVDPKEQELEITPCSPWHHPGISALPYSLDLSQIGNHVGPRRSVHRAIFSRRCHQAPPWSDAGNRLTRDKVSVECTHRRFAHIRKLAHHGGRNVAPPGVSLPGPVDTAVTGLHWLRAPSGEFEQRFLYGDGPAQVGFGLQKPHHLCIN